MTYSLDLKEELKKVKKSEREKVKKKIAKVVREKVLEQTEAQVSPVNGRGFKELSPEYALKKLEAGEPPVPNLRLSEKMMKTFKSKIDGDVITWGHIGNDKETNVQKKKAFNHNTPKDKVNKNPKRAYLPNDGGTPEKLGDSRKSSQFHSSITKEIKEILKEAQGE